jgi:putative N6-adenine-specific DNA methylase
MKPFTILAVVQPGLEEIAEREINALGYRDLDKIRGGIFLKGHQSTIFKLNLACRTISRVLIEIAEFEAHSFSQLEQQFGQIPWQDFLTEQNVCIRVSSFQSSLYHEQAIADRLIDSLSRILKKTMTIVGSPDEPDTQLIVVHAKHDVFTIRMDTSGAHLHKRGYGTFKEDAPLRETVACAMLQAMGWKESVFNLCDPMCGSGTIPIEAALLAKQIPLSEFREFAFQAWPSFQPDVFAKLRQGFLSKVKLQPETLIRASDISSKAIQSARANAKAAGVAEMIEFSNSALSKISLDKNSAVVTNPPWGIRLEDDSIRLIWKELHSMVKQGLQVYLLLPELQKTEFRYKYTTLLQFSSGAIKVSFTRLEA